MKLPRIENCRKGQDADMDCTRQIKHFKLKQRYNTRTA